MPEATNMVRDWGAAAWAMIAGAMVFVPRILGALLILLIGWGIARLLAGLVDRGLDSLHFDRRVGNTGVGTFLNRAGVHQDPSNFVASLVKWAVLLVTFLVAADALGLPQVSAVITAVVAYIPNVIAAIAILAIGALLADFLAGAVRGALGGTRAGTGEILATVTYWAILVFAILGAMAQLQIAPNLVQTLYTALIGAVALAAAIAFGLGSRELAGDMVAGRELSADLHEGDLLTVGDISGRIERIGTAATWLRTDSGLVAVPNRVLTEEILTVQPATEIRRPAA
jgi:small-conductance mechanosensitive channel